MFFLSVCCACFTENITIIPFFVLLPCRKCGERCNFAAILKTMKTMWFVLFFVLPFVGLAYVLWHVWCLLPLSAGWRWTVVGVGLAAFLTLFLNFSHAIDGFPLNLASACYEVGNSSIFILLYLVIAFLLLDLGRLLHIVPRSWLYSNCIVSTVLFAVVALVFIAGNIHYNNKVRHTIQLTTDKHLCRPVKVVMMSDLHLGYHNRRKELARWVDMINAEHADLILIAGDMIDISMRPLIEENMASELRRLNAPVYACLGNHEYYSGEPQAQKFFADAGITLLRDSMACVGQLCIIGRDDRTNPRRRSVAELMRRADKSRYTILLDHQPYHLDRAERAGVDFQLSGHTHHGQLWPISWITDRIYECAYGPWQRGNTKYYVSSGLGIWGGKFRIGTCSEYVVATINGRK